MDPALLDRTSKHVSVPRSDELPTRPFQVGGIDQALTARILSKDPAGPATRIADLPAGWGIDQAGAFTASVGVFIVAGELRVGTATLREADSVYMEKGQVVGGLRAEEATTALIMTGAPIRYRMPAQSDPVEPAVVRYDDGRWDPVPEHPGRVTKQLRTSARHTTWITAATEWSYDSGPWHRHPGLEECFVLEGRIVFVDVVDGAAVATTYRGGGYVSRPRGTLHAGPGSRTLADTLTFHQIDGELATEWVTPAISG